MTWGRSGPAPAQASVPSINLSGNSRWVSSRRLGGITFCRYDTRMIAWFQSNVKFIRWEGLPNPSTSGRRCLTHIYEHLARRRKHLEPNLARKVFDRQGSWFWCHQIRFAEELVQDSWRRRFLESQVWIPYNWSRICTYHHLKVHFELSCPKSRCHFLCKLGRTSNSSLPMFDSKDRLARQLEFLFQ